MTRSANGLSKCARRALAAVAASLLAGCASGGGHLGALSASDDFAEAPPAPTVHAMNLARDPIPPILLQARNSPYATLNTHTCAAISQEMALLNAALGEDYDTARSPERAPDASAERIAGLLFPFRDAIREVSGANRHEWQFRQAISAGLMRRAYLKGRGETLDCEYPARPHPSRTVRDPTNFDDIGDPPPAPPENPRRLASTRS